MDAEIKQKMQEHLILAGERLEVLEYLNRYAPSFPDWQKTVSEALLSAIDQKRVLNLPCEPEREILVNLAAFLTKIAGCSALIAAWHSEMANGMKVTGEFMENH